VHDRVQYILHTPTQNVCTPPPHPFLVFVLQVRAVHDRVQDILNTEYEASRSYRPSTKDWLASHWQGFMSPAQLSRIRNTGEWVGVGGCRSRRRVLSLGVAWGVASGGGVGHAQATAKRFMSPAQRSCIRYAAE